MDQFLGSGQDDQDFAPVGSCDHLEAISLGALRNLTTLAPLATAPANTLRYLLLEGITALPTLDDLGGCAALASLGLWDSRPVDRRLTPLLQVPGLDALLIGDVYPATEVAELDRKFRGRYLHYRNKIARGQAAAHTPRWRATIDDQL